MIDPFTAQAIPPDDTWWYQIELIVYESKNNVSYPPALISSAGIWSVPGNLFSFPIAI